jgi:hypothetical protein
VSDTSPDLDLDLGGAGGGGGIDVVVGGEESGGASAVNFELIQDSALASSSGAQADVPQLRPVDAPGESSDTWLLAGLKAVAQAIGVDVESFGALSVDPWADYIWANTGVEGGFPAKVPTSLAYALADQTQPSAGPTVALAPAWHVDTELEIGADAPAASTDGSVGLVDDLTAGRSFGDGSSSATGGEGSTSGGGLSRGAPEGTSPPDPALLHLSNGDALPSDTQYQGYIWTDMFALAYYTSASTGGVYTVLLSDPAHQSLVASARGSIGGGAVAQAPAAPTAVPDPSGNLRPLATSTGGVGAAPPPAAPPPRAPVPLELQQALDEFAATPPEEDPPTPTMEEALAYGRFLDELGKYRQAAPRSPPPDEPSPFAPGGSLSGPGPDGAPSAGDGAGGGNNRGSPGVGGAPRTGGEAGNDEAGNEDLSGASGTSGRGHAPRGLSSAEQEQLGDALLVIVALASLGVGAPGALVRALGPAAQPFLKVAAIGKAAYSLSQVKSEKDPGLPSAAIDGIIAMSMIPPMGGGPKAVADAATEIKGPADATAEAVDGSTTIEGYRVGPHGSMPSPRPGAQSHHGVMSRWMESKYGSGYNPNDAPGVLLSDEAHNATRATYNTWRAETKRQLGGTFDWAKVSEEQMRDLAERMFDAANVPEAVRSEYWRQFNNFRHGLGGK